MRNPKKRTRAQRSPSGAPKRRIGLFGGTFDPIHWGHLLLAESAREWAKLDEVWFLPGSRPPHKTGRAKAPSAPFPDRLRMTEIACAGHPSFRVSDRDGRRTGPCFTIDLVREVRAELGPEAALFFLIGADWVSNLGGWREVDALFELVRFLVIPRPGFGRDAIAAAASALGPRRAEALDAGWIPAPAVEISSTDLRERFAADRSVRYRLPPGVEAYVRDRGLYGSSRIAPRRRTAR